MFDGANASRVVRQVAYSRGLAKVAAFDILSAAKMLNEDDECFNEVVVIAFSAKRRKVVEITAGDIFYFETVLADGRMARV